MRIYLYRHGQTPGNSLKQYIGSTDQPVSEEGLKALAKLPAEPEIVYVTPMIRTQQTAGILFPNAKQVVVENLKEMDFGIFECRSYKDMEHDPEYQKWIDSNCEGPIPNGEQQITFSDRILKCFRENILTLDAEEVYTVTHGGTIMAILHEYSEPHKDFYDWMPKNGHGYVADWNGEKLVNIEEI